MDPMDLINYSLFTGVCHADELMYLFNLDLPLILCDVGQVFGNYGLNWSCDFLYAL